MEAIKRSQQFRPRLLPDTNIWRYIVDEQASKEVIRRSVESGVKLVVAPAVVYETLRLRDPLLRSEIVNLQANRRWLRLMPEAYYEAEEIRGEIARLRPEWLSDRPDLSWYRTNVADWRRDRPKAKTPKDKGFWGRLVVDTDEMATAPLYPFEAEAKEETRLARKHLSHEGVVDLPPLDSVISAPVIDPLTGTHGRVADAWRWQRMVAVQVQMSTPTSPYQDWLRPFLKSKPWIEDRGSWEHFWLAEVRRENVPRNWTRWACTYLQQLCKWTPGTPADAQLATYWMDAEFFVSADKALVRLLDAIRGSAPRVLARGELLPGGTAAVNGLLGLMSRC